MASTHWPTRDAYDAALLQWHQTLSDPQLRGGQLARVRDSESIARYGGAGLYVCVYRIDNFLVRCFRANPPKEPPADIAERYAIISAFIAQNAARVPALIPIDYQPSGIEVLGQEYPIVKMPFLTDAVPLGRYIARNHDQTSMALLAEAWLALLNSLEAAPMAHGDLDLTNVLVQTRDGLPHLRLIDYDNVWIPALDGRRQTENGHEHFQHPAFLPPNERAFNAEMDRFSGLVIYLSLLALNQKPQLYDDWDADESSFLLLLRSDYQQIAPLSARLAVLRDMPSLAPYVDALVDAMAENRMPAPVTALARDFPVTIIAPHRPAPPAPVGHKPRPQVDLRPRVMAFPNAPLPAFREGGQGQPSQPTPHQPPTVMPPSASPTGTAQPARARKLFSRGASHSNASLATVPLPGSRAKPHSSLYALSDLTPPPPGARPFFAALPSVPPAMRRAGLVALIALILIVVLALSLRH